MLSALHKSKQLYLITLDRVTDYIDLLKVEMKIREYQLAFRMAGFAVALLFGLLATIFLGLAIIISFWDTPFRALAAWGVVLLYGATAAVSMVYCIRHFRSPPLGTNLRHELQRDINVIKENL
jgi:uncharacterized membrane protein YqjE